MDDHAGVPLHSRLNGVATPSTIDIIFQLGVTQDEGTPERCVRACVFRGE